MAMIRFSRAELARRTLQRQFPNIRGRGPEAVLALFDRLGPVQSQAARAPFLTASSRLPGVSYDTVNDLLTEHQLVKTTNLRGTVHTSTADAFPRLDAVARLLRATQARQNLDLGSTSPEQLYAEVERFCAGGWRPRAEIVEHIRGWLGEHGGSVATEVGAHAVIWGHSGLLRRPRDTHWERRTDTFHRTARTVLPDLASYDPATALRDLVLTHLGSYGPVTRADLAFFFGVPPAEVDAAVADSKKTVQRVTGEDGETYLELTDPPTGGTTTPGLRLLPEFDGLLLGFAGRNRDRFCTPEARAQIWNKANGLYAPVVLHDNRLVATWRTLPRGQQTDVEVTMLRGQPLLGEDVLADQIDAVQTVLGLTVADIRIRTGLTR